MPAGGAKGQKKPRPRKVARKPAARAKRPAARKPPSRAEPPAHGKKESTYERIYKVARKIPRGRVATYGQLAVITDRCTPRMVGYAMASIPAGSDVPWHRVINSRGEISFRGSGDGVNVQRQMLEAEGVRFDDRGRVDLKKYGWTGPGRR